MLLDSLCAISLQTLEQKCKPDTFFRCILDFLLSKKQLHISHFTFTLFCEAFPLQTFEQNVLLLFLALKTYDDFKNTCSQYEQVTSVAADFRPSGRIMYCCMLVTIHYLEKNSESAELPLFYLGRDNILHSSAYVKRVLTFFSLKNF